MRLNYFSYTLICRNFPVCPPVSFGPGGFLIIGEAHARLMRRKIFKSYRQILSILRGRGVKIGKGLSAELTSVLSSVTMDKKLISRIADGLSAMDKNAAIQRDKKAT